MADLIHLACGASCESHTGPDPPDPDRWGNRRVVWSCPECGERATVTTTSYGATLVSEGFEWGESVEWTVPL